MLKSEIFRIAMRAVASNPCISADAKIEVIKELLDRESVAKYMEKEDAEKAKKESEDAEDVRS